MEAAAADTDVMARRRPAAYAALTFVWVCVCVWVCVGVCVCVCVWACVGIEVLINMCM